MAGKRPARNIIYMTAPTKSALLLQLIMPKNLRVLGLAAHNGNPATIGVELEGQIFAPLLDVQGNIRRLINPDTRAIEERYDFTAFGEELRNSSKNNLFNPWRFASKRLDPELGLIYYGKRYYDPRLGRWLTTDPAGFVDGTNLYQYLLNNPYMYVDAEGEFVIQLLAWGVTFVFPTLSSIVVPVVYGVVTGAVAYGGYKLIEGLNTCPRTPWDAPRIYDDVQRIYKSETDQKKPPRTEPKDLSEQLALEEAKAKPQNPDHEIMPGKINDPRYPKKEWKKAEHIHKNPDGSIIDIHYWENRVSGEKHGFKFKND